MNKLFTLPVLALSMLGAQFSNAQNWTSIPTPVMTNLILFGIDFPPGQDDIGYAGGSTLTYNGKGTMLKSIDQGATWNVVWSSGVSGTGITAVHFLNADTGFAGTQAGEIMKTMDGGATWNSFDFDAFNVQGEVNDLEFRDDDNGVLSTIWNGIYYTTDGGATWTPATTSPSLGQMALCYADATTLFSCGNNQSIFKSTDGGANWTSSYSGAIQTVSLGIDFLDANNGMVTSEDGQYFKTTNGGATWTTGTVPNQFGLMRGVVMLDLNDIFVCATPGQVFRTMNGGTTWADDSGVNPNPSYYSITFTPNGTGFVSRIRLYRWNHSEKNTLEHGCGADGGLRSLVPDLSESCFQLLDGRIRDHPERARGHCRGEWSGRDHAVEACYAEQRHDTGGVRSFAVRGWHVHRQPDQRWYRDRHEERFGGGSIGRCSWFEPTSLHRVGDRMVR